MVDLDSLLGMVVAVSPGERCALMLPAKNMLSGTQTIVPNTKSISLDVDNIIADVRNDEARRTMLASSVMSLSTDIAGVKEIGGYFPEASGISYFGL